jgi:release factor glutamine methyltransferase
MTYSALENKVIASLVNQYGQAEARSIQRFLFECFTGLEPAQYLLLRQTEAWKGFEEKILQAVSQLAEFVPVQYVTGITWFCGLKFSVRPGVLIPRPETEEMVMKIVRKFDKTEGLSIIDIGTGSGVIAICLEKLLQNEIVSAIDISDEALRIAKENAVLNGSSISFQQSDILNREDWNGFGRFNLIVSNPPYVRQSEKHLMRRNVLDYEPETALFVEDSDPLIFYSTIAEFALEHLETGGELWFEINETEGNNISVLLKELGFTRIHIYADFNGKSRFVSAFQPANN